MKKLFSALCATALAASVAIGGALPATAAPASMPMAPAAATPDVVQVRDGVVWKKRPGWNGNNWNGNRNWNNGNWNGNNGPRYGWYKGHRGYPYRRYNSDRFYNGFWFPAGAFVAGAIIGGAIANNNNYSGGGSSHVEWCYDRYRSYRAYDNTFQPYHGPRQQCYSPYS